MNIVVLSQGLLSRIVGGSHFPVGVTRRLLLSSRVSLLVINLLTIRERVCHYLLPLVQIVYKLITNDETRDDNNNRRVTT